MLPYSFYYIICTLTLIVKCAHVKDVRSLFEGMSLAVWVCAKHLLRGVNRQQREAGSCSRTCRKAWHTLAVTSLVSVFRSNRCHCQAIFLDPSLSSSSSTVGVGAGVRLGVEWQDGCRGSVAAEEDTGMSRLSRESERARLASCWGQRT